MTTIPRLTYWVTIKMFSYWLIPVKWPKKVFKCSISTLLPAFVIFCVCVFFKITILEGVKQYLSIVLTCIFLNDKCCYATFHVLIAQLYVFHNKCLLRSFAFLKICRLFTILSLSCTNPWYIVYTRTFTDILLAFFFLLCVSHILIIW